MLFKLFLLFTLVTLTELFLLVKIAGLISFWPTVGLVLVTGAAAAWLSRQQGRKVLAQWQGAMAQGRLPEDGVVSGLLLLVGCVLLLTPGVLTDLIGLGLLIPPSRKWLATRIQTRLAAQMKAKAEVVVGQAREGMGMPPKPETRQAEGRVIDVESTEES